MNYYNNILAPLSMKMTFAARFFANTNEYFVFLMIMICFYTLSLETSTILETYSSP